MQIASFQNVRLNECLSFVENNNVFAENLPLVRNGLNCVADEVLLSSIVIFPPSFYL
jgi:hypothetical protein